MRTFFLHPPPPPIDGSGDGLMVYISCVFIFALFKGCSPGSPQKRNSKILYISRSTQKIRGGQCKGSVNRDRGAVVKGVEHIFDNCVSQHLSGAGASPAGSVGRDFNLQKLNFQYLTTSVAVVLVVR